MINNFNIITRFIDSYKSKLSINTINLINEKKYSELWIYHNNNYYDIIETPITKDYIQKLKITLVGRLFIGKNAIVWMLRNQKP